MVKEESWKYQNKLYKIIIFEIKNRIVATINNEEGIRNDLAIWINFNS